MLMRVKTSGRFGLSWPTFHIAAEATTRGVMKPPWLGPSTGRIIGVSPQRLTPPMA